MQYSEKLARLAEKIVDLRETIGEELPNSRERSLAFTKLEECEMWLGKALMLMQDKTEVRTWLKNQLEKTDGDKAD